MSRRTQGISRDHAVTLIELLAALVLSIMVFSGIYMLGKSIYQLVQSVNQYSFVNADTTALDRIFESISQDASSVDISSSTSTSMTLTMTAIPGVLHSPSSVPSGTHQLNLSIQRTLKGNGSLSSNVEETVNAAIDGGTHFPIYRGYTQLQFSYPASNQFNVSYQDWEESVATSQTMTYTLLY